MFPPLNPTSRATSRGGLCVCPPFKPWFGCFGDIGDGESLSSAPNEHQIKEKGGLPPNATLLRRFGPKRAKSVAIAKFEIPLKSPRGAQENVLPLTRHILRAVISEAPT